MPIFHRKLLLPFLGQTDFRFLIVCCDEESKRYGVCEKEKTCSKTNFSLLPPPPPAAPPPPEFDSGIEIFSKHHFISTTLIVVASLIACFFLFAIVCAVFRSYYRRRNRSRRRQPIIFGTQDFLDEDHGPRVDHPIWYINTVGLQQSVIDSIAVFKFKKSDVLIEGTDCSVCLSEFEEDESLRLLPKCDHAFHIPCIDTWLRSHKNCPLCRAPIVSDAIVAQGSPQTEVDSNESNSAAIEEEESHGVEGGETSEDRSGSTSEDLTKISLRNYDSEGRILSDLGNNQLTAEELQPIRRSISMDSSSASVIYNAVSGILADKKLQPGSFDSEMAKLKIVGKRSGSGSSSLSKFMKSSSARLQKGPIPMKRSLSFASARRTSNQDLILPL